MASLLINSVQRVPRYLLLLKELLKLTPAEHADFAAISQAHTTISQVASHVNEEVRNAEQVAVLRELEANFVEHPKFTAVPGRRLLKRGQLYKKSRYKDEAYEFFIFNDLVAYAKLLPYGGATGFKFKLNRKVSTLLSRLTSHLCVIHICVLPDFNWSRVSHRAAEFYFHSQWEKSIRVSAAKPSQKFRCLLGR